jgi:hypothetical protein
MYICIYVDVDVDVRPQASQLAGQSAVLPGVLCITCLLWNQGLACKVDMETTYVTSAGDMHNAWTCMPICQVAT